MTSVRLNCPGHPLMHWNHALYAMGGPQYSCCSPRCRRTSRETATAASSPAMTSLDATWRDVSADAARADRRAIAPRGRLGVMVLYVVRHGRAEEPRGRLADEDRALTERGRREVRAVLGRTGAAPTRILTSPLRRARETADIAAEVLRCPEPPVPMRALGPDSSAERIWGELAGHADTAEVMVVGHQPLLGVLYAFLLGSPGLSVSVQPGSVGCIELARLTGPPSGELCWLLPPG